MLQDLLDRYPDFKNLFNKKYSDADNLDVIDNTQIELFLSKYNEYIEKNKDNFDVIQFANFLNIDVYASKDFTEHQNGKIKYTKNNDDSDCYSIYINQKNERDKQLVTVAHEIGHFVCDSNFLKDKKELIDSELFSTENNLNIKEIRANEFAVILLMPKKLFLDQWKKNKANLKKMAKFFDLSTKDITIRAYSLGIIC